MNIDWTKVEAALAGLGSLVTKLKPIAALGGPVAIEAAEAIQTALETADNVVAWAAGLAPGSTLETLKASLAIIQDANDELAQEVAAS